MPFTADSWLELCKNLGARDNPDTGRTIEKTYRELVVAYSGPKRHYHDLGHINEGLEAIDEIKGLVKDPMALRASWICHDVIMSTRPQGFQFNELCSSVYAFRTFFELNVPTARCSRIMKTVIATMHDHVPDDTEDWWIVDIDLLRLAAPPDEFNYYSELIRGEYGLLPEVYYPKRVKYFRRFLENRKTVYLTAFFGARYEKQAMENLKRVVSG